MGLRLVCREAVSDQSSGVVVTLTVGVLIMRSVGEKVVPPKFEPTSSGKQTARVVRPVSQFG